ncbi:MAG: putative permease [bacterium P3]|nr:MAG: putative permease [bacterium P3]KWW41047.1 MAG: putative permease [bacterium F083]
MKKIDHLILRSFIGPLLLTFAISVFVLLMQFVWKYIDDMVGKGLDFMVIMELLFYASATFVPMAMPIAVLFASIMTMGNFGEKYELVAMKAGGVSLSRVMLPMAFVAVLMTVTAFYFANNVMPTAVLKYKSTLYDITHKKPAINLRPSEYFDAIDGYVIRINEKNAVDGQLRDILIYDHSQGLDRTNVIVADNGYMQTSPDDRYLVFTLNDGYTYSESTAGDDADAAPLTRISFRQQVLTFDISSFAMDKTNDEFFKGIYQMMNVSQLDSTVSSLDSVQQARSREYSAALSFKLQAYQQYRSLRRDTVCATPVPVAQRYDSLSDAQRRRALDHARTLARSARQESDMYASSLKSDQEYINRHYIEWQRKYTLSLACLLLFLIGAPFGSIVRRGGLGLPLVASVGFFVLYYVIGMIAEKAVREGALSPMGMWLSSLVFLPIGLFLTLKATTDSSLFDLSSWVRRFKKAGRLVVRRRPADARMG